MKPLPTIPKGCYPAMITPFTLEGKIDYPAVKRLLKWYNDCGCAGVLGLCASSETTELSLEERVELGRFILENKGNLTVVISGHVSNSFEDQVRELNAMAALKPAALCLIVSRLNQNNETEDEFIANIQRIMDALDDKEMPLGFYEMPGPNNRSLSEKILKFCASTGRFVFMKETSCETEVTRAKIKAVEGTNFGIYNANSTLLLESLKDGAAGFCGIMANYHADLYQWLCDNFEKYPKEAERLSNYLGVMSAVTQQYPATAKYCQHLYGAEMTTYCRKMDGLKLSEQHLYRVRQMEALANELRAWLKTL